MPRLRTLLLIAGDAILLFSCYLVASIVLRQPAGPPEIDFDLFLYDEFGLVKIAIISLFLLLGIYFLGLYERIRIRSRRKLAEDLILVFGVAFLLQAVISYARASLVLSRWAMIGGSALSFVFLILWRSLYSLILIRYAGRQRILFLGDTPLARTVAQHIVEHPEKGFEVVGCLAESIDADPFPGGPLILLADHPEQQIVEINPDRVPVSGTLSPDHRLAQPLLWCSTMGLNIESLGDLYESLMQRVAIETITLNQLIFSPAFRCPLWMSISQEIYSRLIAIVGIFCTWPLMLLTAIAVRLDSEGPALLRQKRVGRNGEVFEILKFRSMYIDADARFGRSRATEGDPRITRVGRFIRITRLDELPQFINVLLGSMTLVGPRPEMPVYVNELSREIPIYAQRLRVKPGITGWAQLFHQPEVSTEDTKRKIEYDLYYIKHMSPLLDFLIMFHTIKTVLLRIGAR